MEQSSRRVFRQHVRKNPSSKKKSNTLLSHLPYCSTSRLFLVVAVSFLVMLPLVFVHFVNTVEEDRHELAGYVSHHSPTSHEGHGPERQKRYGSKSLPQFALSPSSQSGGFRATSEDRKETSLDESSSSCAICFFGLPRSFKFLVLPSIIKNVLIPNLANRCNIFFHYYDIRTEGKSRSGLGGAINTSEVLLLKDAVDRIYNKKNRTRNSTEHYHQSTEPSTKVSLTIIKDTNETFWERHHERIHRYMSETDENGKLLFFPWMAKSYDRNSVINIIKQWHSIQSVFEAMESLTVKYDRVAMLRNDVVFVTPFDVWRINSTWRDTKNEIVAVPNFARFPVNDRLVYGPTPSIKIWSTERFQRLEDHARTYPERGYGLHSERFLAHSIFPAIRQELGYEVAVNPQLCFFRARADNSCWINDCATRNGAALGFRTIDTQKLVEDLVGPRIECKRSKYTNRIVQLHCAPQPTED